MSYNEWKYEKEYLSTTTNSEVHAKELTKHKTIEEFAELYKVALIAYLAGRYEGETVHIEDIAICNIDFAEAFYITLGVI